MKKFKRNSIIILLVTVILMWYILKDNLSDSIKLLLNANYGLLVICFLVYIIYFLLESFVMKKLIDQYNKKYTFKNAARLNIYTKFFNGITPFGTGGQPLQVYELHREGLPISKGTIFIVENFIVYQSSVLIITLLGLITNFFLKFIYISTFLTILLCIGLVINFSLIVVVFLMSLSKSTNKKIVLFIVKLLHKIKLVKNVEEKSKRLEEICMEYYDAYQLLMKNKLRLAKLIGCEIVTLAVWFMLPYFIFLALGWPIDLNMFITIFITSFVTTVGSFVPIPGGSGGIEYAFIGFFTYFTDKSYVASAVIIWRFINYYLPMVLGAVIYNLKNNK